MRRVRPDNITGFVNSPCPAPGPAPDKAGMAPVLGSQQRDNRGILAMFTRRQDNAVVAPIHTEMLALRLAM